MNKLALIVLLISAPAFACTGFYESDVTSGLNRICYYNHLGGSVAYTIPITRVCPVTVQVPH